MSGGMTSLSLGSDFMGSKTEKGEGCSRHAINNFEDDGDVDVRFCSFVSFFLREGLMKEICVLLFIEFIYIYI